MKHIRLTKINLFGLGRKQGLFALCISTFLMFSSASAQALKDYNRFSFEISGGIHIPVTPTDGINASDYTGFKQFQAGARYMFNPKIGAKVFIATNRFDNGDRGPDVYGNEIDYHNTFTRIGIEAVTNLGDLLNMSPRFTEKNGVLLHGGAGLTYSSPSQVSGKVDRMGILVFGITPQRKLSRSFAIFADLIYVANLKQHYGYNGVSLTPAGSSMKAVVGGFMSVNFGLTYYIGTNDEHADWYWGN